MAGGGLIINYEFGDTVITVESTILFVEGGDIHEAFSDLARELEAGVRIRVPPLRSTAAFTPWATGRLASTVYSNIVILDDRDIGVEFGADTPYARFVHDGTGRNGTRFIYTTAGWAQKAAVDAWIKDGANTKHPPGWMMPVTRIPYKTNYLARVKGQRANPFVTDAYAASARRHPMLPPMRFKRTFD